MSRRDRLLGLSGEALLDECEMDRFRASGPGGQKRNKTESAVRLRHLATGIQAHASESRSQHENRVVALRRLRLRIALELREPVAIQAYATPAELTSWLIRPGRPTRREREAGAYLRAVAALLDVFVAVEGVMAEAAEVLGVTTNLLSKRIAADEALARKVNELRAARDLRPLR
ncbi:MAG TPA: peptide chain release factor-like protein [Kofleriaceae bacterium]|nr:peptide chain release factor-like protein [Kofleriaceae bacterium]